jgi:putative peptidoglycan lipid II flippase
MAKDALENTSAGQNAPGVEAIPLSAAPLIEVETLAETSVGADVARPQAAVGTAAARSGERSERREIVKSATLVMLGNLGSSIMGMVRQVVVAATGQQIAGPFLSALVPAQTLYDFIVNGSVPGVLIPTFNDFADKRDELRRLVFTIVNIVILIMLLASILFAIFSPQFVNFLVQGFKTQQEKALALHYSQIIFFSLIILGPFSVLLAALYALKEFGWPAFATAAYHAGIILGAVVGSFLGVHYFGQYGLAFGVIVGALGEIALLIPGMHNQQLRYLLVLDLKHPALRRILKLYAPISLSFLVSMCLVFLDQHLSSLALGDGAANVAALKFATTLIQFPIGLVAAALSFAVLPTLTTHAREGNIERFKETLLLGLRLGLLLMIPAAAGLIVLQLPIVDLIFRHHNYTAQNAQLTAVALQNYAYQLPFVAMDQLLIAAFYARKNTIIPVAVLFVSILGYLAVALPFYRTVGVAAMALANTTQNSLHAIILLVLLRRVMGTLHIRQMLPTLLKILLATALMVAVAWGLQRALSHSALFSSNTLVGTFLTVVVAGGVAAGVYVGMVLVLRVEEVGLLKGAILAKLGKR